MFEILCFFSADCFDDGTDYPGNEIASLQPITSPYFCLRECQKRPECLFYSFNTDTQTCSLKTSDGIPTSSSVTVSGSVVCEPRGKNTF